MVVARVMLLTLIAVVTLGIGVIVLGLEVRIAQGAELTAPEKSERHMTVTVFPRGHEAGGRAYTVVLLCDTNELRATGLQGHRPLKPGEAALFRFERPEAVTFWMGSVTFPIDIVFISPDGHVAAIAPRCQPGSAEFYGSGVPVSRVIETAAGSGIVVGDRVIVK